MNKKNFDEWIDEQNREWAKEHLSFRLRYFVAQADRRRCKIAGSIVGPSFGFGVPVPKRELLTEEKAAELNRRFLKNKAWADYCQNRRYELAGLL